MRLYIPGSLPGLNEYTRACRANRYAGAEMKSEAEAVVAWSIRAARLSPLEGRYTVRFAWHEAARRRDPDNIAFARKFILDALVAAGVLDTDGWRRIAGFSDSFHIAAEPHIVVTFEPEGRGKE